MQIIVHRHEFELDQYASKEYLLGLRSLPIPNNRFPNFDEISPLIENATGWSLLPVAGFLDEELFFEINTKKQFPVTDIIRESPRFDKKYSETKIENKAGYTPEPDIFHDVQGHVPFLMNEVIRAGGLKSFDKLLGALFGLAKGTTIVAVLCAVSRFLAPQTYALWSESSALVPQFVRFFDFVHAFLVLSQSNDANKQKFS